MPIAEDADGAVLSDARGVPVARLRWRDEAGEQVVAAFAPSPGVAADRAARAGVRELGGRRIKTADEDAARALIGAGCTLIRASTDMHRQSDEPIPVVPLVDGWTLGPHGWDAGLAAELNAAYGPGQPDRVTRLRSLTEGEGGLAVLPGASARLRDPAGRSMGEVFTVGPVPWGTVPTAWVLDLAVGPGGQGRGFGAALLAYAMSGTRHAGLTVVGLTVTDGNPARRLYDRMGFRPVRRHFEMRAPQSRAGTL